MQFYALDCGAIDVADMSSFSREGKFDGEKYALVVPCFLIRHPKGDLLWDAGLEQSLVDTPDGIGGGAFHSTMKIKLTDQLAQLGLAPNDIEFLSISHSHPDHAGNANLLASSTFIANQAEHSFMFSDKMKENSGWFELYAALENADTVMFENEHDVFGDGNVVITSMPGHTPGSSVLLVRLRNAGPLLLTGDLYTHAGARELRTVPTFNTDAQATLKSMDQFEALAKKENARVIIQHEKADFEKLPTFPEFLD
ncbi:MAG: N-acyl homoserine lactonase family protein [Alphaproteobacteria bacterium]|nr:N-acyl homoserine lactonase family protein [Alphaproteobacteria bacterium]